MCDKQRSQTSLCKSKNQNQVMVHEMSIERQNSIAMATY